MSSTNNVNLQQAVNPATARVSSPGSATSPGRRPSQYTFTDPNAASAASFSADLEYFSSPGNAPPSVVNNHQRRKSSPRRGSSAAPFLLPENHRVSTDDEDEEPDREGRPDLQSGAALLPPVLINEEGDSFFRANSTTSATTLRARRTEEPMSTNQQSPLRQQLRRPSEAGWVERGSEAADPLLSLDDDAPTVTGPGRARTLRRRSQSNDSESDVCVTAPSNRAFALDVEALLEVIGSDAKGMAKPAVKSYQDPPPAPRMVFYSERTGPVKADTLETLAFPEGSGGPGVVLRDGPFWIDVTDPSHSEMVAFSRLFGIHPLTTEDIQTEETREKCEMFLNYYFICIRTFDEDEFSGTYMQPINVSIVVMKECVLSFHCKPVEHTNNVLKRIDQLKSYGLHITPDWINYALIDDITDSFMPLLKFIELEVDSIDDLVLILKESEQSDMLRRIGHARKKVMQLLRLLSTKADVLKTVIKRCGERLPAESETSLYLGDIQDHAITMVQNLSHYEKTLARAHSNYLAQISIEITVASNRTNDVVMKMTAMASILLPLNVVTGLFGMNVTVPGENTGSLGWFFGIVVCMLAVATMVWYWARTHKLV
ncbi:CorA metal ion transporter [Thoreauomyces humboldtii]|nr:CorA metal ion transporter [Thoreauomyces humboldtii]